MWWCSHFFTPSITLAQWGWCICKSHTFVLHASDEEPTLSPVQYTLLCYFTLGSCFKCLCVIMCSQWHLLTPLHSSRCSFTTFSCEKAQLKWKRDQIRPSGVRKWPFKPMITFKAQRKCWSLHVTVTATPQSLTTDLRVSQAHVTFCLSHVWLCHFVAPLACVHTAPFVPQPLK